MEAVSHISTITALLTKPGSTVDADSYSRGFYDLLVDRWSDIIHWMKYWLLGPASNLENLNGGVMKAMGISCYLIDAMLQGALEGNAYSEEIATAYSTLDLLFLLVCKRDDKPPYRHHQSVVWLPTERRVCQLIKLVSEYSRSALGWKAMEEYLTSIHSRKRGWIIKSLVCRGEEVVSAN
jgi:hypothetical protein